MNLEVTDLIYTVTFNPAVDYVVHTNEMQVGRVNRSSAEEIYFGGKGINVSIVLGRLGVRSIALGFIAGFTGKAIADGVRREGVETDFIELSEGFSRICVKIKSGTETELNGRGPAIGEDDINKLFAKLDTLTENDTLVLAGSVPGSLPENIYEEILKRLKPKNIRTVVDAANKLLLNVLEYEPFIVKPNNFELEEMFGETLDTDEKIIAAAMKLRKMGAKNVLVSMAEKGAILVCENGDIHKCPACKGTAVNSVGAGDSMLAGFIAGLEQGDFSYALKLGTAAGGATAFSNDLAKREEIEKLMKEQLI